jgi:hypothetical protein
MKRRSLFKALVGLLAAPTILKNISTEEESLFDLLDNAKKAPPLAGNWEQVDFAMKVYKSRSEMTQNSDKHYPGDMVFVELPPGSSDKLEGWRYSEDMNRKWWDLLSSKEALRLYVGPGIDDFTKIT